MNKSAYPKVLSAFLLIILVFIGYTQVASAQGSVLTNEQKKWLEQNSASISFAPEKDFPPMIWSQYNTLFGVSKDYFDFIQQKTGVQFKVREAMPIKDILELAKSGKEKIIISSVTLTPERSEYLLFTRPYFFSPAIFVSVDKKNMTGKEILEHGYSVAVGHNFGAHEYLRNRYPQMKLLPFDNDFQVIQAVMDKHADIGAIDVASLMYLIKENNFSSLRKVGDTGFIYSFSFAVPRDLPILREILDNAIESIPDDFQETVFKKWGVDNNAIKNSMNEQLAASSEGEGGSGASVTTLVIVASLFIIFFEFLLHRYIFKIKREKHDFD